MVFAISITKSGNDKGIVRARGATLTAIFLDYSTLAHTIPYHKSAIGNNKEEKVIKKLGKQMVHLDTQRMTYLLKVLNVILSLILLYQIFHNVYQRPFYLWVRNVLLNSCAPNFIMSSKRYGKAVDGTSNHNDCCLLFWQKNRFSEKIIWYIIDYIEKWLDQS